MVFLEKCPFNNVLLNGWMTVRLTSLNLAHLVPILFAIISIQLSILLHIGGGYLNQSHFDVGGNDPSLKCIWYFGHGQTSRQCCYCALFMKGK